MDNVPLMVICATVLIGICVWRWKEATKGLIYLVIFEGALRKWVFPSLSSELYLLKDVVMAGALLGWVLNGAPGKFSRHRHYIGGIALFGLFGGLEMFNPAMGSPVGGVFGLKAYIFWGGYPFLLAAVLRTREDFDRYLRRLFLVAIPVCLLAVVQSRLPPESPLNVYARERSQFDTFGVEGSVRVTGTFPFLAGYSNFLIFVSVFLLPLALYSRSRWVKVLSFVLFPLIIGTSFMTGSRWPVFFLGLFVSGFIVTIMGLGLKRPAALKGLILPVTGAVLAVALVFRSSLSDWIYRTVAVQEGGDTFAGRSVGEIFYAFDPGVFSILGDGIGSTNNGAIAIGEVLRMPIAPSNRLVEAEPGRVMAEVGLVGFVLWYGLRVYLIINLFRAVRRLHDPYLKALAVAGGWFMAVGIMAPVPFDTTLGAFYWFVAGLPVVLTRLDRNPSPARTARQVEDAGEPILGAPSVQAHLRG